MSLNNDYTIQFLVNDKLQGFRDEAAEDRLVRIATDGRRPWWHRLVFGPVDPATRRTPELGRDPAWRQPVPPRHRPRIRAPHVARW